MGRVRALLTLEDWVYLASLLVPLAVYEFALKVVRVFTQPEMPGPLGFLDQVRSDVLFDLGFAALWVGLFAIARCGVARGVVLALFHLTAIAVAAISTVAHYFYKTTGSALDYHLVASSLSSFADVRSIIASETTALNLALLSLALFFVVAGPAVLTRLVSGDWHVPVGTSAALGAPRSVTANGVLPAFLAALVLVSLALIPSLTQASTSFARDPLANLLLTEFEKSATREPTVSKVEVAEQDLPTDTTLAETPYTTKRNVVMVFMESTRARSTTPYREITPSDQDEGEPPITPFMDRLAGNSLFVENAYTVLPHTSKALTGSNCGVAPPPDTNNTEADPDAIPAQCLPDLLKQQGYSTAFFQSATESFERRRMLVDNFGYEDFFPLEALPTDGFEQANYFGYEDDVMLQPSEDWLQEQKEADRPFMASYLTVTAHHDYQVPGRYGTEKFDEDEEVNRYVNTVRYQDFFLKNLIQQYKEMGLYEDTIFVIVGDHGEAFGEHGRRQHDNVPYEEGLRIPMLIHDPQRFAGGMRIEGPANQLDLLPTVTGLLGYGVTGGTYPGSPLYALPQDRTIMASCYQERTCLASIQGREKYVYHFGNQPDELFNLDGDPLEKRNLADGREDEVEKRRRELLAWQARVKAAYERLPAGEETTGPE